MSGAAPFQAIIFQEHANTELADELFRFRKTLFVDERGWNIPIETGREVDEFDTAATTYCALLSKKAIVGSFRAIRCDGPYLAKASFSGLAATRPYPSRRDYWEISRFGVPRQYRSAGLVLYAVMFHFAELRGAKALVAVADLGHERVLRKIGVKTRRYGPPVWVGTETQGARMQIVAGEIPLAEQKDDCMKFLRSFTAKVDIRDDTLVRRPARVSA
jgi:acyl homoserine lactone synthase